MPEVDYDTPGLWSYGSWGLPDPSVSRGLDPAAGLYRVIPYPIDSVPPPPPREAPPQTYPDTPIPPEHIPSGPSDERRENVYTPDEVSPRVPADWPILAGIFGGWGAGSGVKLPKPGRWPTPKKGAGESIWDRELWQGKKRRKTTDRALAKQLARRMLNKLGPVGRIIGRGLGGGVIGGVIYGVIAPGEIATDDYERREIERYKREAQREAVLDPIVVDAQRRAPLPSSQPLPQGLGSRTKTSPARNKAAEQTKVTPRAQEQLEEIIVTGQRLPPPKPRPVAPTVPRPTAPPRAGRGRAILKQLGAYAAPAVIARLQGSRAVEKLTAIRDAIGGLSSTTPDLGTTIEVPSPLTPIDAGLLPSATTGPGSYPFPTSYVGPSSPQNRCDCKKRKTVERRTCRAKAAVRWAGGPNKGKPAGKRCISWES